jgi:hypothetical protein
MTGSLVLPLVALAMNALTVAVGAVPLRRLHARIGLAEGGGPVRGLPA